jgi:diadenosine tetraphosphate (Ap4A) HIT family hydrolase
MLFELHPNLANKSVLITLPLSVVLLQDEVHFPWLILVPQRLGARKIMELSFADQQQLLIELDIAQRVLQEQYEPTHINVAAIGNKIPQLHLHVIARFSHDPAWPATAWDYPVRTPYPPEEKLSTLELLAKKFSEKLV